MSYEQDQGYIPETFQAIMTEVRENINTLFLTEYTEESFQGTNWYKYFYALVQRVQADEVKTAEIFHKLQNYITFINARISRPVNTTMGIVDRLGVEGFVASVKPMIDADAGKIHICVDTDAGAIDYEQTRLEICTLISQITVAGAVTQGTEVETIVLSNGQAFDFKFNLPNYIPILLRLTITLSENNQVVIGNPDDVKVILLDNIARKYRLGKNFEPQTYFTIVNAPWASQVKLEYSTDAGATWKDSIFDSSYDDLYTFGLPSVSIVEV